MNEPRYFDITRSRGRFPLSSWGDVVPSPIVRQGIVCGDEYTFGIIDFMRSRDRERLYRHGIFPVLLDRATHDASRIRGGVFFESNDGQRRRLPDVRFSIWEQETVYAKESARRHCFHE